MLKPISILALIMFCGIAAAQPLDPDPDGMSFYFGEGGTDYCLLVDDWVPAIGTGPTVLVYLLVTRPSTPVPYIQGWEAQVIFTTNSYIPTTSLTLTPGAINLAKEPGEYVVVAGGDAAIPIEGETVILATAELTWLGFEGHAEAWISMFGIQGSQLHPEGPGYHSDEAVTPMHCECIFGSWGPVAWVNGDCHWGWPRRVSDESMTWGQVKNLY